MLKFTNLGPTCLALGIGGHLSPFLSRLSVSWIDELSWIIDLAAHWQLVWVTLTFMGVALIGLSAKTRQKAGIPAVIGCAGVAVAALAIQPGALRQAVGQPGIAPTLNIASANLLYGSADLKALRGWLNDIKADLVVLQEVTPAAASEFSAWGEYTVKAMNPQDDGFGMAVFSRNEGAHISWGVSYGAPYAVVKTQLKTIPLTFYGIHPPPPAKPSWHGLRNSLFAHLVEEAEAGSSIVAGDFNATPWSAAMPRHTLFRATSLMPTWNGMLPIDQIMATSDWSVLNSGRGPDIGSDHRPVWAQLTHERPFEPRPQ